jgi:hypothetical protein
MRLSPPFLFNPCPCFGYAGSNASGDLLQRPFLGGKVSRIEITPAYKNGKKDNVLMD